MSNPKVLTVDFCEQEEVMMHLMEYELHYSRWCVENTSCVRAYTVKQSAIHSKSLRNQILIGLFLEANTFLVLSGVRDFVKAAGSVTQCMLPSYLLTKS